MKKTKTISQLKKAAWKEFSKYIRRSKCKNGIGKCVTCGIKDHWKNLQAGHGIGGRGAGVLFLEDIVYPQCVKCNIFRNGAYDEFSRFLILKYGMKKYEHFLSLKYSTKKWTRQELESIRIAYKKRNEQFR